MMHIENQNVDFLKPCIIDDDYSFGFPKKKESSDKLMAEFNEVLGELRQKGVAPEIKHTFEEGKNRITLLVRNPQHV